MHSYSAMTNASQLLDRDYVIFSKNGNYNKYQIDCATAFLKQQLWEKFQGKTVGRTVYLYFNELFWIISSLRACWQLGCTVFAADYNPNYNQIPEFKNFHEFIDIIIGHDQTHATPCTSVLTHKPKIIIESYYNNVGTPDFDYKLNENLAEDLPAVTTHTSGTTGYPKLVHYSHREVIALTKSQVKFSQMQSHEFPGHSRTLHHGSLFLNYALPMLSICNRHYCFYPQHNPNWVLPSEPIQDLLDRVAQLGLTRMMIPYNWIRYADQLKGPNLNRQVTLHTIMGATDQEMKKILKIINPKAIINMWGCSEMGSCFHSVTDESNVEKYNPNKFELVNPDLEYVIESNCIKLKWKFSQSWRTIGDLFEIYDNDLWWRGRVNFISRNSKRIDVNRIKEFIETTFKTVHFSLVLDYEFNRLYLAAWDDHVPADLDLLNNMLTEAIDSDHILNQIKHLNYRQLLVGMKPSQPILLYMFRNDQSTP